MKKLVERRDLWSISVYSFRTADALFNEPPDKQVHFVGERKLRCSKDYMSVAADPFLFTFGERIYLFYEVKTDYCHGTIHAQSMSDDGVWQDHGEVLKEAYHLSYPQVFLHQGQIFMVPEAAQSGTVVLYEAEKFPYQWRVRTTLIEAPLRDPTLLITKREGIFLLATTSDYELKLYHSQGIEGPFQSTGVIVTNERDRARCAGGIVKVGGLLLRPAQDCSKTYGERINFQEITDVSSSSYAERFTALTVNIPEGAWRSRGSHHISCEKFGDSFIVAVDGRGADSRINSFMLGILRLGSMFTQKL